MNELLKQYKTSKSPEILQNISDLILSQSMKLEEYLPITSELLSVILNTDGQGKLKFPLLTHFIDLFLSSSIPIDQLSSLSLERIFNIDYPLYRESNKKNIITSFYNFYFPPNQEFIDSIGKDPVEIDFFSDPNWIRANAIIGDNNILEVRTKNKVDYITTNVPKNTFRVQQKGSILTDYEWRKKIKKGDEVDYLDDSKTWYLVTVTKRNKDYIKLGLRLYRDEGTNYDMTGRKIFGWNERFDIETTIYDPKIQKPRLFSREIISYPTKNFPIDSKNCNLFQINVPLTNKDVFVIPISFESKYYNLLYIQVANYFFKKFNLNSEKKEENFQFSLESFEYFTLLNEILFLTYDKLSLPFAKELIMQYKDKAIELLLDFSKKETRNFKKANIQSLLKNLKDILSIIYFESDCTSFMSIFYVQFGLNCLKLSNILEKRLLGIDILNQNLTTCSSSIGLSLLKTEPSILSLLFKSNPHPQIIQKSHEILKSLFSLRVMDYESLKKLYEIGHSANDPEIVSVIYKNLIEGCSELSPELIKQMIDLISFSSMNRINHDISLLCELSKAAPIEESNDITIKVLDQLYKLILSKEKNDKTSKEELAKTFYETIGANKPTDQTQLLYCMYLQKIMEEVSIDNFEECFILLKAILLKIPSNLEYSFKNEVINILFVKKNIFLEAIEYLKIGKYNKDLLEFLSYLIVEADKGYLISIDIVKTMFQIFLNEPLVIHIATFIKYLQQLLNKKIISAELFEFLFTEEEEAKVDNKSSSNNERELPIELFEFYWYLFLRFNKLISNQAPSAYNGIIETKYSSANGTVFTSYSYSPNNNPVDKSWLIPVNVQIKTKADREQYDPFKYQYFSFIWKKLLLLSPSKIQKVVYTFFDLIAPKEIDLSKRGMLWREVINMSIKELNTNTEDNEKSFRVRRNVIKVLTLLIEESEKKGTAGCKSHFASLKSHEMTFTIENNIIVGEKKNEFLITVQSNLTIWDFKREISRLINAMPECLQLSISENKEISERDNGKLLCNKLQNNSKVKVSKSTLLEEISKVELVEDGAFTDKAIKAFKDIFDKFSTEGKMSPEQCAEFTSIAIESSEKITPDNFRVKGLFDKYDKDKLGYITLESFLQFFLDAVVRNNKVLTVWKNLKAFNFRNDLKKLNDPLDDFIYDDNYAIMPRFILSNEQKFFEPIFEEQNAKDKELAKEANELVNMICTNQKIYNMVYEQGEEWEKSMKCETNKLKLYYLLQIVESLLGNHNMMSWIDAYIGKNGFEYFIKEKFLKFQLEDEDETEKEENNKIYLCMLQITLTSLELLLGMEKYDGVFEKRDLQCKGDCAKEEVRTKKYDIIEEKFNIKGIYAKVIKGIKGILDLNRELNVVEEEIMRKGLNVFTIITLYLKGDISNELEYSSFKDFMLSGILVSNSTFIKQQFHISLGVLFKEIQNENIKLLIQSTIEETALNQSLMKKYNCTQFLELFEFLLSNSTQSEEKALELIVKIIEFKDNLIFLKYLSVINVLLNRLDKDAKTKLCKDHLLLDILVNDYLLNSPEKDIILESNADKIYPLIYQLIKGNVEILEKFFSLDKIQHLSSYITPLKQNKETYSPVVECRSLFNGYIGISNLQNICYMNSILQQFFNIESFRFSIINVRDNLPPKGDINISDDNFLHQLQKMFTFLQLSNRNTFSPKDFVYSFKDIEGKPTDFKIQCDAQEFLSRFMDKVETSLAKTKYKYLMKGIFNGETCSQLLCMNGCGSIRNRFEELLYISLDIKQMNNIDDCLKKYISEEYIDDFFCEECKKKTRHIKRLSINKLPNFLFIHLQRIAFNYETFQMEKINTRLEYPKELKMKSYCTETVMEGKIVEQEEYKNKVYNHTDDYYEYQLKGVVVHSGTAAFGHYYSFINCEVSNKDQDKWVRFDDSSISKYFSENLSKDTFGKEKETECTWVKDENEWGESTRSAYILVYERKMKSPLLVIEQSEKIGTIATQDVGEVFEKFYKETDPFNIDNSMRRKFLDCENKPHSIEKEDFMDSTIYKYRDEYLKFIPFYSNTSNNVLYNNEYFREVISDNIIFRNDENIYRDSFVNFIMNLAKELKEQKSCISIESAEAIFTIINTILVQIVSKSSMKSEINSIILELNDILREIPQLSKVVLKSFLKNRQRWMFSLIITIDDKLNSPFQNYFTKALQVALTSKDIDKESELYKCCIEIIDYLYFLIPYEISKNWTKMASYLDIFKDLAHTNNKNIIKLMIQRNTINLLGDFFLGKESPFFEQGDNRNEIGNKTVTPKFSSLISTISILARHCPNLVGKKSPLFIEFEDKGSAKENYCQLNERDAEILSTNAFYTKAIKGNYENEEMSRLLSHLMFEDRDFTSRRIYSLLDNINSSSRQSDIKETFSLLYNVFQLDDSLTQYRIETIFGFPLKIFSFINGNILKEKQRFKFYSSLFPNKDTLIDKVINKWKHLHGFIAIISYFYTLIYSSTQLVRYFYSLPHPIKENLKLHDHIRQLAEFEIENYENNKESKDNSTEILMNIFKVYDDKVKEAKKEYNNEATWEICFAPPVKFGRVLKEVITNISSDEANIHNVYLLRSDFIIEAGKTETIIHKKEDANSYEEETEIEQSSEIQLGHSQDKFKYNNNISTLPQNFTNKTLNNNYYIQIIRESPILLSKLLSGDIDNEIEKKKMKEDIEQFPYQSITRIFIPEKENIQLEQENDKEKENKTNNKVKENEEQKEHDIIIEEKKKDKIIKEEEETSKEEDVLKDQTQKEKNEEDQNKEDKAQQFLIRRYLVVNISNYFDYKTTSTIQSDYASYCPVSEIISFTKRNSMTQIATLFFPNISDINKDDKVEFSVETFEISNDNKISELFEKKNIKRSRSFEEKKIEELKNDLTENQRKNSGGAKENQPTEKEGFEMECRVCGKTNLIFEEEDYKCKGCNSFLFQ